jgi:hypothetical protein
VEQKYRECLEMWCWRRTEKNSQSYRVRCEEVLRTAKKDRNILQIIKKREASELVTYFVGTAF